MIPLNISEETNADVEDADEEPELSDIFFIGAEATLITTLKPRF